MYREREYVRRNVHNYSEMKDMQPTDVKPSWRWSLREKRKSIRVQDLEMKFAQDKKLKQIHFSWCSGWFRCPFVFSNCSGPKFGLTGTYVVPLISIFLVIWLPPSRPQGGFGAISSQGKGTASQRNDRRQFVVIRPWTHYRCLCFAAPDRAKTYNSGCGLNLNGVACA